MSYNRFGASAFVQRVTFETELLDQHKVVREMFNFGTIADMNIALDTWQDMVASVGTDDQYEKEMKALENKFNEDYETRYYKWLDAVSVAKCPDVIPKPNPNRQPKHILRQKYRIIASFLSRKGIHLTLKRTQRI